MVDYDPYSYETHADPYPIYRRLRDEAPAYYNEQHNFWALTRYDDCRTALKNFRVFSSAGGITLEPPGDAVYQDVMTSDPPDHTRLRHIVSNILQPTEIAKLEPMVRRVARELIEAHRESGSFDLMSDFAAKLPMLIFARLLGYPPEDDEKIQQWTNDAVHIEEGTSGISAAGIQAMMKLGAYNEKVIAQRLSEPLRDDFVSPIIAAIIDGRITEVEARGYLQLLAFAGHETTTKLIGNAVFQLWRHPDQREEIIADPSLIPGAIEETLRFDTSVQLQARTVTADYELHGRTIPAGSRVAIVFGSANRDERKFERTDIFDIHRNSRDHIGFGYGLHSCLGAPLARLEARIAIEELLRIAGRYEVDHERSSLVHSANVRGFASLPFHYETSRKLEEVA